MRDARELERSFSLHLGPVQRRQPAVGGVARTRARTTRRGVPPRAGRSGQIFLVVRRLPGRAANLTGHPPGALARIFDGRSGGVLRQAASRLQRVRGGASRNAARAVALRGDHRCFAGDKRPYEERPRFPRYSGSLLRGAAAVHRVSATVPQPGILASCQRKSVGICAALRDDSPFYREWFDADARARSAVRTNCPPGRAWTNVRRHAQIFDRVADPARRSRGGARHWRANAMRNPRLSSQCLTRKWHHGRPVHVARQDRRRCSSYPRANVCRVGWTRVGADRALRKFSWRQRAERIAFFLRANSPLYETLGQPHGCALRLLRHPAIRSPDLARRSCARLAPTVIVAPPNACCAS